MLIYIMFVIQSLGLIYAIVKIKSLEKREMKSEARIFVLQTKVHDLQNCVKPGKVRVIEARSTTLRCFEKTLNIFHK